MSKALTAPQADQAIEYWESEAQASCKRVFERAFGPHTFAIAAAESSAEPGDCIWTTYNFPPAPGQITFGLDRAAAIALGHRILEAKHRTSEHDHHALHAIHHLNSQVAAELASALGSRLGTKLGSIEPASAEESLPSAHDFALSLEHPRHGRHLLLIRLSRELIGSFSQSGALLSEADLAPAVNAIESRCTPRNLDLLLDVEMPVSISFGSTRISLKDVAKLSSGSTIELNRTLSEPIQVLVNNCSIARGEVVVIDGKFAVRIKDIVSGQDRLNSLAQSRMC